MLPVVKLPKYISPSALMALEGLPNTFYLQRLAPNPFPRDPQGPAAGVGSAFDSYVKHQLAKELGMEGIVYDRLIAETFGDKETLRKLPLLKALLHSSIEGHNMEEAVGQGRDLAQKYFRYAEKLNFTNLEICSKFYVEGVPVYMKGDAEVKDKMTGLSVPLDWKVMGYGSKSGVSPAAGYMKLYQDAKVPVSHKNYREDITMEEINPKWATQLAVYGWQSVCGGRLVKREEFINFPAYIDALIIRPTGVRVARYRGWITQDFQLRLLGRIHNAWNSLHDSSFVQSLGNHRLLVELLSETENWWG